MDQVEEYDLPLNFSKETDTRFKDYQAEFGDESCELDALPPDVLVELVEDAIDACRESDLWGEMEAQQEGALPALLVDLRSWDATRHRQLRHRHRPRLPASDERQAVRSNEAIRGRSDHAHG